MQLVLLFGLVRMLQCFYRRTQEDMPAIKAEYEQAVNEGVKFRWNTSVTEFYCR